MDDRRFEGIINLYGEAGFTKLVKAHVLVLGIGGVGSWICEALVRSGISNLTIVDLDDICVSNINRQIHSTDLTVGKFKVDIMSERLLSINPKLNITTKQTFFNEKSSAEILSTPYDFVIDAIDNVQDKVNIIHWCFKNNCPVITVGAAGGKQDPSKIIVNDLNRTEQDKLLFKVRRHLRRNHHEFRRLHDRTYKIPSVYSTEKARSLHEINADNKENTPDITTKNCNSGYYGSSSIVTATMGFMTAAHVLKEITASDLL